MSIWNEICLHMPLTAFRGIVFYGPKLDTLPCLKNLVAAANRTSFWGSSLDRRALLLSKIFNVRLEGKAVQPAPAFSNR